ncbi:transcriptional regulator, LacI family [Geodermatophilus dictyosporus]|uniref:Transcriptional regulator, LacI family n=1 Tax=Geodermatophilus dictyosporus TaxID=1523247 RepID=A0A1I5U9C5_9ACTN|nr:LacI family DNA-binding transcriptional regulator [Geodermatophilus dictyosporus]SFP91547.1 transcriptional regulator, LacI family [Geodermatophilus dictyosporus]
MPTDRPVTLRAIAEELGVSAKTVSNAFSRPDQLSDRLREEVLATARRLGYPGPNPLAAGLRRGRVGAIGVAYDNGLSYAFDDPVAVELLAGASTVAEPAGAGLLLVPGSVDAHRREAAVTDAVVDGMVVSSLADDDPLVVAAVGRRLPLAVVDQPRPDRLAELGAPDTPWVGIDDRAAAAAVAGHVLALGHRRIAVVSFGLHREPIRRGLVDEAGQAAATYAVSRDRLAGYRDAAAGVGIDWAGVPVFHGEDSTPAVGAAGAAAVLATDPRPTALLCTSDRLAEGVLRTAARLGLRVPADLSVAGFDDAAPAAGLGLTTVRQPTRRKGEEAVRALLDRLAGQPGAGPRTLPTELVVRTSTGPPPVS